MEAPPRPKNAAGIRRKKATPPEIKQLAQEHAPEAVRKLVSLMRSKKNAALALSAATALLDRGYGRPAQTMEHGGPGGGPIQIVLDAKDQKA